MINIVLNTTAEADIIRGCIAGNKSMQKVLYQKFAPKMFAICLRYSPDYHTAEDMLQEGFVKAFNKLDKFRDEGVFEGWLRRVFVNTAIEILRKQKIATTTLEDIAEPCSDNTNTSADGNLLAHDLMSIIRQLPIGYRTVFNLYAIEGYSHKEIAKMLDISIGTSKSQLSRARAMLQSVLNTQKNHLSHESQ